jgi:hypothetical protein
MTGEEREWGRNNEMTKVDVPSHIYLKSKVCGNITLIVLYTRITVTSVNMKKIFI